MVHARRAEVVGHLGCTENRLLAVVYFTVEDAQGVRLEPPLAILAELEGFLLQKGPEFLTVKGTALPATQRVDLEFELFEAHPYHQRFSPPAALPGIERECIAGARVRSCFDCKMEAAANIAATFAAARERRAALEAAPETVDAVLRGGNEQARERAGATMREVRAAMGLGGVGPARGGVR